MKTIEQLGCIFLILIPIVIVWRINEKPSKRVVTPQQKVNRIAAEWAYYRDEMRSWELRRDVFTDNTIERVKRWTPFHWWTKKELKELKEKYDRSYEDWYPRPVKPSQF